MTAREALTLERQGAELARELEVTPGQALGEAAHCARLAEELGVAPDEALNGGVGVAGRQGHERGHASAGAGPQECR